MPSRFGEFRFLDTKNGQQRPPQVRFQAQKKVSGQWRPHSSVVTPTYTFLPGQIYVFASTHLWGVFQDWVSGQEKQVVVQLTLPAVPVQKLPVQCHGYVIRQSASHSQCGLDAVSLFVSPTAGQSKGFILTENGVPGAYNVGDEAVPATLYEGTWGSVPEHAFV